MAKFLNVAHVKALVRAHTKVDGTTLRAGATFIEALDLIVRERIERACVRNRSLKRRTMQEDELKM